MEVAVTSAAQGAPATARLLQLWARGGNEREGPSERRCTAGLSPMSICVPFSIPMSLRCTRVQSLCSLLELVSADKSGKRQCEEFS